MRNAYILHHKIDLDSNKGNERREREKEGKKFCILHTKGIPKHTNNPKKKSSKIFLKEFNRHICNKITNNYYSKKGYQNIGNLYFHRIIINNKVAGHW